jgi:leucyl-tRNA synthetase
VRRIQRKMHQTIKRVTDDFEGRWHFNTCIAAIMEFVNELYGVEAEIASGAVPQSLLAEVQRNLVLLLEPFAPYLAHELWETLGEHSSLLKQPWPKYDAALAKEDEIEIPVQINGKNRSRIVVPADSPDDFVRERALADERVRALLDGKQVVKAIVVPGKLVNLVVR